MSRHPPAPDHKPEDIEARALLTATLARYRALPYHELSERAQFTRVETFDQQAANGERYTVEVVCMWDDRPWQGVLVIGFIFTREDSDGLSDEFVVCPEGEHRSNGTCARP